METKMYKDTRGRAHFDIIPELPWQVSISHNYKGTIRGFHQHLNSDEYWYCVSGQFKVVLALNNFKETTYLSEGERIFIKKGYWHGFQALTEGAILMECLENKHDPNDNGHVAYDTYDSWEVEKK